MPTSTNLNRSPYHDSFDSSKNYSKVLFKPTVAVQTRELNELQSAYQNQIEKFADNIFAKGTIVSGCNFSFYNIYPYAKLLDTETDGTPTIPSLYVGKFVKNSSNLRAYVVNFQEGFESSDPDLKTIYVNYINSGDDFTTNAFSVGDLLEVYDNNTSIWDVKINNGSLGFSNNESLVITPVVAVNVSTGSFSNGDYMINPTTGANLEIIEADDTTLANTTGQVILKLAPRNEDLANASLNSTSWSVASNDAVTDASSTVAATIENVFGVGAAGTVKTDGAGKVTSVTMTSRGGGYDYVPNAKVRSANNTSGLTNLDLEAQNFLGKVYISSDSDAVGNGYAFGVSNGVIYQKGNFIEVRNQTVIVEKYNSSPNAVAVGFATAEEIIDSNIDSSLLDNVLGTENRTAPGADRLKLTPTLTLKTVNDAQTDDNFFSLVEWNSGNPYKHNQTTVYSRIGDEMSQRMFDHAGNFVIDTFQIITQSPNTNNEGLYYRTVVDPGQAYINGRKVQTTRNYNIDVKKGTDTNTANIGISLNYGNYVRVNNLGGLFQYSTGDTVKLYDTAKTFLANIAAVTAGNTSPLGTQIGTARIRSLTLENGIPGEANTAYRMFLFDVQMNSGKNFKDVRSLYYDGTNYKGIADAITTTDPSTQSTIAKIEGKNNQLLFNSGAESIKNSNNTTYKYRTIDQTAEIANNGTVTKSIASDPDEFFPITGGSSLTDAQMKEIYLAPMANDVIAYANLTGTIDVTTTSANGTGTGTSYLSDLDAGDYVQLYSNGTTSEIKKVVSVIDNTTLMFDSNVSFANAVTRVYRAFPKNVPVPFGTRSGLTANVDANSNILTLDFGITFAGTTSTNSALGVNIERQNVSSESKTANRNQYVKIQCSNAAANTIGPWCLGVADAFRLEAVYMANTTNVNTNSTVVTSNFYIDHNQNPNYLGLGYLYKNPRSGLNITSNDFLLCKFSYFTRASEGYFDTVSYLGTANATQIANLDSQHVANLSSAAASLEVPEIYTYKDEYFDLLNQFDFRPAVANTAAPGSNSSNAPINPGETISFGNTADPANDKKFPLPDSIANSQIEFYLGRIDHVYISGQHGHIYVLSGMPDADPRRRNEPNHPKNSLLLNAMVVPPYPNIPMAPSDNLATVMYTGIGNERFMNLRKKTRTVKPYLSSKDMQLSQPMVYTMLDIGNLNRRVQDLEYYVSLSFLETSVTNKVIPSSIDGTLNRFKFGFFADDFDTDLYRDINNPQYAASIEQAGDYLYGFSYNPFENSLSKIDNTNPNSKSITGPSAIIKKGTNRVVPPKYGWVLQHVVDNMPYVHEPIVRQLNATETPTDCVTGTFIDPDGSNNFNYYFTIQNSGFDQESKTENIIFGSNNGTAEMWFYNYFGSDKFDIYQANTGDGDYTLVASTNASANAITSYTADDKAFLSTNIVAEQFYKTLVNPVGGGASQGIDLDKDYIRDSSNNDFVSWGGKLTWNHDASNGRFYKIVTTKGTDSRLWRYLLKYPTTDDIDDVTYNACEPPPITIYNGGTEEGTDPWVEYYHTVVNRWSCTWRLHIINTSTSQDSLKLHFYGMKPNTKHDVYVDGVNVNAQCKPRHKSLGDDAVTNDEGKLWVEYFPTESFISKFDFGTGQHVTKPEEQVEYGSTGYSLIEAKANFSSARLLIGLRGPNSFFVV